jgi:hypothetical protein
MPRRNAVASRTENPKEGDKEKFSMNMELPHFNVVAECFLAGEGRGANEGCAGTKRK